MTDFPVRRGKAEQQELKHCVPGFPACAMIVSFWFKAMGVRNIGCCDTVSDKASGWVCAVPSSYFFL